MQHEIKMRVGNRSSNELVKEAGKNIRNQSQKYTTKGQVKKSARKENRDKKKYLPEECQRPRKKGMQQTKWLTSKPISEKVARDQGRKWAKQQHEVG